MQEINININLVKKGGDELPNAWASFILAVITAVATIFMCIANCKSAKATREQVKEMKRQFDELNRPYITVEVVKTIGPFVGLKFANKGKRIANSVEIHFSKEFLKSLEDPTKTKLEVDDNRICIIGVNQSYVVNLWINADNMESCNTPIIGDVVYYSNNKEYREDFHIDIANYKTFYHGN